MTEPPVDLDSVIRAALGGGARAAEVYVDAVSRIDAHYFAGGRVRASTTRLIRVGVAADIGDGRVGVAGGVVSATSDAAEIASRAVSVARAVRPLEGWPGFNPSLGRSSVQVADRSVAETSVDGVVDLSLSMARLVEESGVRAAETGVDAVHGAVWLANSESGKWLSYEYTLFTAHLDADAGEGAVYGDWIASRKLDVERVEEMARNAASKARDVGKARPVKSGVYTVILTPKVVSDLVSYALAPAFSGESVAKKRSPLTGRLGDRVLDVDVSIYDDPLIDLEYGSRPFDDEGVASVTKTLVRNGVLREFLHTRMTAIKLGGKPGNAERMRPWSLPSPAPSNIVLEYSGAGGDEEALITDTKKGLVVHSTIGTWLSDPVSGKASMTVTLAYLINSGEIVGPVKGVVISGNIYEMVGRAMAAGPRECWFGVCSRHLAFEASVAGK